MLKKALKTAGRALKDKAFPGGQLAVLRRGEMDAIFFGNLTYDHGARNVDHDVLYDLASVTKIVSPTALAMRLVQDGRLKLETEIGDILADIADKVLAGATIRHLLSHSSGLPAWKPLYREIPHEEIGTESGGRRMLSLLKNIRVEYEPGNNAVYSDLDFMLLGFAIEKIEGETLDALARKRIFEPLGMTDAGFLPRKNFPDRTCAPTENCPWRKRVLIGEVDDENTYAAGGVVGQAGLFATARSLIPFCREMVDALKGKGKIFAEETVREFSARAFPAGDHSFCLGFDGRSPRGSRLPTAFGPRSFGHWGFTGTGLWIEPDKDAAVVLLTNRVHPSRENDRLNVWRPLLLAAAMNEKSA